MAANTCRSRLVRAALVCALLGCSQDAPSVPDAGLPLPIEVQPSGPLASLEAPGEVVAFAGSDAPDKLLAALASLGARDFSRGLAERYGVSDPEAIDLHKPMRAAVFARGKGAPLVLLLGLKSKEALLAALPPIRREGEAGHAFAYSVGDRTVYLSFVGEHAAFSERAELVPRHREFFAKLAGATPGAGLSAVVPIEASANLLATELRRFGAGAGWTKTLDELARAELAVDADSKELRAALTLRPRAGTALHKTVGALDARGTRMPALLAELPSDSALFVGASVDPDGALGPIFSSWLLQTPTDSGEPYAQALADFSKATTGELAFALHRHADKGPVLSALVGLRDAVAARLASRRARAVFADPRVVAAMGQLGARLLFQPNAYQLGIVPVDMVVAREADPTGGGPALTVNRALGVGSNAFFALSSSHMALEGELGKATFGKHAQLALIGWRTQKKERGVSFDRKKAAPGTFLVAQAGPDRMAALAIDDKPLTKPGAPATPVKAPAPPKAPGDPAKLSVGADEGALHFRLTLPLGRSAGLDEVLAALQTLP